MLAAAVVAAGVLAGCSSDGGHLCSVGSRQVDAGDLTAAAATFAAAREAGATQCAERGRDAVVSAHGEAYAAYLDGLAAETDGDELAAAAHFRDALRHDASYTDARAALRRTTPRLVAATSPAGVAAPRPVVAAPEATDWDSLLLGLFVGLAAAGALVVGRLVGAAGRQAPAVRGPKAVAAHPVPRPVVPLGPERRTDLRPWLKTPPAPRRPVPVTAGHAVVAPVAAPRTPTTPLGGRVPSLVRLPDAGTLVVVWCAHRDDDPARTPGRLLVRRSDAPPATLDTTRLGEWLDTLTSTDAVRFFDSGPAWLSARDLSLPAAQRVLCEHVDCWRALCAHPDDDAPSLGLVPVTGSVLGTAGYAAASGRPSIVPSDFGLLTVAVGVVTQDAGLVADGVHPTQPVRLTVAARAMIHAALSSRV